MKRILTYLLLLGPLLGVSQSKTISGYINDDETGESLIGATIIDIATGKGAITNTYGFFSLTSISSPLNLRISYVGYTTQEVTVGNNETTITINLIPGGLLEEVVISAEEELAIAPQMSKIDLPVEQIQKMPVLMGEADVMKSLQLLPGIQGGTEGTSGIYVRGGGPDQNLILLDGVPVYNASHLFGFFSVFNPDAINNVSVMKGGFPARYGGRLSSVIDISLKEGNNKRLSGSGSVGLISSKFTLEGPIASEKTSFLVSARRTYIDILAKPVIAAVNKANGTSGTGGYFFHDYIGKINHRFSEKDRLFVSTYMGLDKGAFSDQWEWEEEEFDDESGLKWGNIISAVRWNHLFTPKLFSNVTATYSRYQFNIFNDYINTDNGQDPPEVYEYHIKYSSGIQDIAAKIDFDYLPSSNHSIKFGAQGTHHTFSPGVLAYKEANVADTTIGANDINAIEYYVYAEDDWTISKKLRVNIGAHYSGFSVNGRYYDSFQPRISARWLLNQSLSAKASYVQMAQYIHLLTNVGIGLPTDLWVPATDNVRPQLAQQYAIGLAKNYGPFEISIEGYYKEMQNLISYKEGASYFNTDDNWENKVVSGDGWSYGGELLIQKKTGKLSGWIGYTLSKTERQFDELNFGKKYPYKFDRRHDLSVVAIYDLSERIKLSGTWVYGTGNAVTMPQTEYIPFEGTFGYEHITQSGNDDYYWNRASATNYGERNSYRMRAYHRGDVGITFHKQKPRIQREWSFGAYNVYSRRNAFFIDFQSWGDEPKFVQYSIFPIIPYFRYGLKF
ncbi:MAG: TonB-dependent receptor [Cyclobacteriaceae bacterium]